MAKKHRSLFKTVLEKVSKLPKLISTRSSAHKHMKPGKGFNQPVSNHAYDYMKELNDAEFEKLIAMIFKQRGYNVSEKRDNDEHAVDVVLELEDEITLVQYQHWREYRVDIRAVKVLYKAMKDESARHGIVITSGTFTEEALDYSLGKALMLINGIDLAEMIEVLSAAKDEAKTTFEEELEVTREEKAKAAAEVSPPCPLCGSEMKKRTAKKGRNAGRKFWGCSQYPNCRGVEQL